MASTNYDIQIVIDAQNKAQEQLGAVSKELKNLQSNTNSAGKNIADFGKQNEATFRSMRNTGAVATAGIIALGSMAVSQAGKLQDLRIELDTLTGSAEKGKQLFSDIQKEASKTPFESAGLVRATSTMLQFGIAQKDVMQSMKMLGDISGGNANKLQSLSLVFGQISSAGKLTGQDLLQLVNLGFNPLKSMSDRTGESMASLREKMTDGQISFQMIQEEMRLATEEGGLFFGMMDKKSQTFSGVMSTMKDNIGITLASLGGFSDGEVIKGGLLDMLTQAMHGVMPYLERLQQRSSENPEMARNILLVAGAVAGLVTVVGALGLALPAISAGFALLTGPIGLVIAGIVALGLARTTNFMGIQETTAQAREWIKAVFESAKESILAGYNEFLSALGVTNSQFREALKVEISFIRDAIKLIIGTALELLLSIFGGTFEAIRTLVIGVLSGLKDMFVGTVGFITSLVNLDFTGMVDNLKKIFGGVSKIIVAPFESALEFVKGIINGFIDQINKLISAVNSVGSAVGIQIPKIEKLGQAAQASLNIPNSPVIQQNIDPTSLKFQARAKGGPVNGNNPYLVGEKGPELFVPKSNGNIVPNDKVGGNSISIGNINIAKEVDADRFIEKMKQVLTRDVQLSKNFNIL